jgi:hypothetical protein
MQGYSEDEPSFDQWVRAERLLISESCVPELAVADDDDGFADTPELSSGKVPIIPFGYSHFWSGHGDRSTVPTWARGLGFPKEVADMCGRWRPEASDEYVRNAKAMVLDTQGQIAGKIRAADGRDIVHEGALLKQLGGYCIERGLDAASLEEMFQRIGRCKQLCELGMAIGEPFQLGSVTIPVDDDDETSEIEPPSDDEAKNDKGRHVVSMDSRGGERTLHIVGNCWRRPGIHYAKYQFLDPGEEVSGFHRICIDCVPRDKTQKAKSIAASSDSSSSGSDDSSEDSSNS